MTSTLFQALENFILFDKNCFTKELGLTPFIVPLRKSVGVINSKELSFMNF
jgi:hypothetical protein